MVRKVHMFEFLVPSWENCLGRNKRYGFVGGSVSLGASFEVSINFLCLVPVD